MMEDLVSSRRELCWDLKTNIKDIGKVSLTLIPVHITQLSSYFDGTVESSIVIRSLQVMPPPFVVSVRK